MLISKGMIVLLASLQWIRNNVVHANTSTFSTNSLNSTNTSPPTSAVSLKSPTGRNDSTTKSTVMQNDTQSNNVTPPSSTISLSQTTYQQHFSTKDVTHSSANINGTSLPSEMPTTSSGLSTISESSTGTFHVNSPETVVKNFTTTNSNINSTFSPSKTQINGTTVQPANSIPNTTSTTLLTTKNNNATTKFWISAQTTSLQHKLMDSSAEAREHQKEKYSNGAVVFGAIIGAVLGSALIVLVVYFMCGQRKSEAFGHRRLYDDTRNDPVLRLDNISEPYGTSFGEVSYYNPMTADEMAAQNSSTTPCDSIPMNDMTSSQPSE